MKNGRGSASAADEDPNPWNRWNIAFSRSKASHIYRWELSLRGVEPTAVYTHTLLNHRNLLLRPLCVNYLLRGFCKIALTYRKQRRLQWCWVTCPKDESIRLWSFMAVCLLSSLTFGWGLIDWVFSSLDLLAFSHTDVIQMCVTQANENHWKLLSFSWLSAFWQPIA